MATLDLAASLDDALSQIFAPRLAKQMNRMAVLATILPKVVGQGKNCAWDAEFSGASAATFADGADVSAYDVDTSVPATLDWGRYRSSFAVTGLAISAAQTSHSPEELTNLVLAKAEGCASKLLSVMNAALYNGAAGSTTFVGLETALDATGTYANIAKGTYAEWAGNELANGGTVRDLTKALLDDAERAIYDDCGVTPNFIVTTPLIAQKFKGLFDTSVRHEARMGDISVLSGLMQSESIPEAVVRNLVGFYDGIPVFRDKDCPAGKLFMLNSNEIEIEVLPQPGVSTATMVADKALVGNKGDRLSGFIARMESMAKTGDADKWSMKVYAQLKVKRPNANAKVEDLPTS